jgi:hypothetical protein
MGLADRWGAAAGNSGNCVGGVTARNSGQKGGSSWDRGTAGRAAAENSGELGGGVAAAAAVMDR